MTKKIQRTARRAEALTEERIVQAAIAILDAHGEAALTFRVLAAALATGSGAIYWHLADKRDLLAAAADHVVGRAMGAVGGDEDAVTAIRTIALAMFDAFDAHPWLGAKLAVEPGRSAMLRFFEGIGGRLQPLGVPAHARFDAWSALVNYILGVAGQNAANARRLHGGPDRTALLANVAADWAHLDPAVYPFLREVAVRLPGHDDREQFLAGLDLILVGIHATREVDLSRTPTER